MKEEERRRICRSIAAVIIYATLVSFLVALGWVAGAEVAHGLYRSVLLGGVSEKQFVHTVSVMAAFWTLIVLMTMETLRDVYYAVAKKLGLIV